MIVVWIIVATVLLIYRVVVNIKFHGYRFVQPIWAAITKVSPRRRQRDPGRIGSFGEHKGETIGAKIVRLDTGDQVPVK